MCLGCVWLLEACRSGPVASSRRPPAKLPYEVYAGQPIVGDHRPMGPRSTRPPAPPQIRRPHGSGVWGGWGPARDEPCTDGNVSHEIDVRSWAGGAAGTKWSPGAGAGVYPGARKTYQFLKEFIDFGLRGVRRNGLCADEGVQAVPGRTLGILGVPFCAQNGPRCGQKSDFGAPRPVKT